MVPRRFADTLWKIACARSLPQCRAWRSWRLGLPGDCVNERFNYLTQVTEFPLVQDSLALMDDIIDNAILRAGGLPLAPSGSLAHLTMFTLRSLPCDLGGLCIWRFGVLAGEIACLRGHTVLYEFAEKYTPRLLEGVTLDFWPRRGRESGVDRSGRPFSRRVGLWRRGY